MVGTKIDMAVHDWDGLRMSSVTGEGVRHVVGRLAQLVDEARKAEPQHDGFVILRPEPEGVWVERLDDRCVPGASDARPSGPSRSTTSPPPKRSPTSTTGSSDSASSKALVRAGASDGDVVWIGDFSFEYETDI